MRLMGIFGGKAGSRSEAPGAADVFTAPERERIEALWRLTALPRAEFDATYGAMLGGFWRYAANARGEAWAALGRETLACFRRRGPVRRRPNAPSPPCRRAGWGTGRRCGSGLRRPNGCGTRRPPPPPRSRKRRLPPAMTGTTSGRQGERIRNTGAASGLPYSERGAGGGGRDLGAPGACRGPVRQGYRHGLDRAPWRCRPGGSDGLQRSRRTGRGRRARRRWRGRGSAGPTGAPGAGSLQRCGRSRRWRRR